MVGEWVVGDVLGLHGLADGLGDGLASGHAVDDLLDVAVLQRNNGVNGLGRVDAVLGGHLMASLRTIHQVNYIHARGRLAKKYDMGNTLWYCNKIGCLRA